jgi:hypothetical protein
MRRTFVIGLTLVAIAIGVLIGVGAYHAGYSHGLMDAATGRGRVVRVIGPAYGPPYGFFPLGFLLFPLFIIGIIFLVRGLAWRRWRDGGGPGWDHHHGYGHGPGYGGREEMFEDWHRRQHEQPSGGGSPPTASASV